MGIFQKIGDWLSDKSDRFIRGSAVEGNEFEQERPAQEQEAGNSGREPLDPFGHGDGEYGGRVPYRSRADLEREAQMKQQAQQAAQQTMQQQQFVQQQMMQQAMQQPAYQPPQQAPRQQVQQPQQQAYPQQSSNVVRFPGMNSAQDGSVYAHVEYVVLLRSRQECKDVIAYIKSNASVFLNMEFIASDSERQRCVDMLSGAAYTLGCALNKISPRGIYLISSPSVRVVLDPAMQKFTAAPEAQGYAAQQTRQRYENEGYQQPQQQAAYRQPEQEAQPQQPAGGSFTTRFQAQSAQRMPTSFGSVMAGNATGMYQPAAATNRYQTVQQ